MKFSFNTFNHSVFLGLPPSLLDQIAAAGAAGYEHIGVDVPSVLAHRDAGVPPAALVDAMAAADITPYELNFWAILPDLDASRAGLDASLEVFDALGAVWLQSVVMGPVDDGMVGMVREAAGALAERGARLAVEYLPTYPVCSIGDVRALSDQVGPPGVGVCVDAHHFFRGPDTFADFDALPDGDLAFLQFCDALPLGDPDLGEMDLGEAMVNGRAMPGDGEFPLDEFCRHAVARGYDGVVSVEILSLAWRSRPLDEYVRTSLDTTREWFDRARKEPADG
jgi:sugar phosphate isomerase/epimerase